MGASESGLFACPHSFAMFAEKFEPPYVVSYKARMSFLVHPEGGVGADVLRGTPNQHLEGARFHHEAVGL
jgi:hypothetical protein